ncbi:MAG: CBS domain-containing protein [Terriglobales bacterium]
MKVRDAMTERVTTASPETTLEELASMMKSEDTGAIPVVDDGELIGIVTDRDIVIRCIAEGGDPTERTAEDIVSENLETIDPDSDLDEAIELMSQKQIRRLPVVDNGELVGILSIGDVAVKQGDEEESGRALKDVSRGVKNSRVARPRAAERPDLDVRDAMQMRETGGRQGISNRKADEEIGRQERVVSIRADGNAVPRGQKKSSKNKAS